jgi:hypothetical protein
VNTRVSQFRLFQCVSFTSTSIGWTIGGNRWVAPFGHTAYRGLTNSPLISLIQLLVGNLAW